MSQNSQTTQELLEDLRTVAPRRRRREDSGLDNVVFGVAVALAIAFVVRDRLRGAGTDPPLGSETSDPPC